MDQDNVTINLKTYSLHELMQSIQSVLSKTYSARQYWIRCEVARISLHMQSGHCYLELIDKHESSIVAQLKAIIWSDRYKVVCDKFQAVTHTPIAGGMKLLVSCSVSFHPLHGLSLTVHDIEPSFTLGEMARMKNDSIERLRREGLFNRNRTLPLPFFPYRIAVISVATSRGYHDFITTIVNHKRRFAIQHTLFEAILQGDNAVPSLTRAIQKIFSQRNKYDAIAIIRGGAGDAGLSCYDEYELASLMALSPLPVITGIGHATNETVAEMVAYKNCITPTAAATFILDKFEQLYSSLNEYSVRLNETVTGLLQSSVSRVSTLSERFCLIVRNRTNLHSYMFRHLLAGLPSHTARFISNSRNNSQRLIQVILNIKRYGAYQAFIAGLNSKISVLKTISGTRLRNHGTLIDRNQEKLGQLSHIFRSRNESLQHLTEKISLLDPVNTLQRGYSITRVNGRAITDFTDAPPGTILETTLATGTLISTSK
jgi:exodeoxyribonuclease VII large subunit